MEEEADSESLLKDWDSCWMSPPKMKKKKKKKKEKDQKGKKMNGDTGMKNENSTLKKKKQKDTESKEVMKKKKKKKKTNSKKDKESVNLGLNNSTSTCNSAPEPVAQSIRPEQMSATKHATSNKNNDTQAKPNKLTSDFFSPKTPKTKKKVAFDLESPGGYKFAKRPRIISPPSQAKDGYFSEAQTMGDNEELHDGTQTGQSSGDDLNSQDLFITQNKFRAPSPEPSSGENTEDSSTCSFPLTHREEFGGKRPPSPHGVLNHAGSSHVHQKHSQRPAQHELPHQEMRKPKKPGQNVTNLTEETCTQHQKKQPPPCPKPINKPSRFPFISTTNTSTQTENLFTTELSFYLKFCQESKATESSEDLEPVDLSLPQRTRAQLASCWSRSDETTAALDVRDVADEHGDQHLLTSPEEIKDESEEELISSAADNKEKKGGTDSETPPSPQSEPEPKSTDTTTSSEDSDLLRLTQGRTIQTRLNESFFFKPKGDGDSPRPDCPLMKFYKGKKSEKKRCNYSI